LNESADNLTQNKFILGKIGSNILTHFSKEMFRFLSTASSKRDAAFRSVKQHIRIKYDKPYDAPILHVTAPLLNVTLPNVGVPVSYLDWTALKNQVATNVHFRAIDATENLQFALRTMEDMEDDLLWSKYGNLHFRNGVGKHLLQVTNKSAPADLFACLNVDSVIRDAQPPPPPPKQSLDSFSWNDAIEVVSVSAVLMFALYIWKK